MSDSDQQPAAEQAPHIPKKRGRKPKNYYLLNPPASAPAPAPKPVSQSIIKIPVSHISPSKPNPERTSKYMEIIESIKSKEPNLNDILSIKDTFPFKSAHWLAKQKNKVKGEKIGKSLRQILGKEPDAGIEGSYMSIETAKSVKPIHKYCDFTGFRAKYTDKKTGIRYYSHSFYPDICQISNTVKNQYLELRNAVVNIK